MLVVFTCFAVYELLVIVSDLLEINLTHQLDAGTFTDAEVTNNDNRQEALVIGESAFFVAAVVVWLRWFHRAYVNVAAVGGQQRYGTGWAIGAWFVPILNLFRPKQIANDIWEAGGRRPGALLGWWWALWLLSGLFTRAVLSTPDTPEELRTQDGADIAASVLAIAAVPLACLIAVRATQRLRAAREARVAEAPA